MSYLGERAEAAAIWALMMAVAFGNLYILISGLP